jgi:phosphoglycolate phosphatase-like HAD superfamily hydrolase
VSTAPLLVFDFDGVLVDGMPEYWWSARRAALALHPDLQLPEQAPAAFAQLRPAIHKGWEMVLIAAELGRPGFDPAAALADYPATLGRALARSGHGAAELQESLERVRRQALERDPEGWLALHRFYPGVVERLAALAAEAADWSVLTTKGGAFAARLLEAAGLSPLAVDGHEQGSKPDVLLRLLQRGRPLWFVEDRRPTLELVRATPGLEEVRCFLALWGYLAPGDAEGLDPFGIHPLTAEGFGSPLARWP